MHTKQTEKEIISHTQFTATGMNWIFGWIASATVKRAKPIERYMTTSCRGITCATCNAVANCRNSQASDLVTRVAHKANEVLVNLLCSHFVLTMRDLYSYIDAVMGNAYSRLKKIVRSGEIEEEQGGRATIMCSTAYQKRPYCWRAHVCHSEQRNGSGCYSITAIARVLATHILVLVISWTRTRPLAYHVRVVHLTPHAISFRLGSVFVTHVRTILASLRCLSVCRNGRHFHSANTH